MWDMSILWRKAFFVSLESHVTYRCSASIMPFSIVPLQRKAIEPLLWDADARPTSRASLRLNRSTAYYVLVGQWHHEPLHELPSGFMEGSMVVEVPSGFTTQLTCHKLIRNWAALHPHETEGREKFYFNFSLRSTMVMSGSVCMGHPTYL